MKKKTQINYLRGIFWKVEFYLKLGVGDMHHSFEKHLNCPGIGQGNANCSFQSLKHNMQS